MGARRFAGEAAGGTDRSILERGSAGACAGVLGRGRLRSQTRSLGLAPSLARRAAGKAMASEEALARGFVAADPSSSAEERFRGLSPRHGRTARGTADHALRVLRQVRDDLEPVSAQAREASMATTIESDRPT